MLDRVTAFQFIPQVLDGAEIWFLSEPVQFFHTWTPENFFWTCRTPQALSEALNLGLDAYKGIQYESMGAENSDLCRKLFQASPHLTDSQFKDVQPVVMNCFKLEGWELFCFIT